MERSPSASAVDSLSSGFHAPPPPARAQDESKGGPDAAADHSITVRGAGRTGTLYVPNDTRRQSRCDWFRTVFNKGVGQFLSSGYGGIPRAGLMVGCAGLIVAPGGVYAVAGLGSLCAVGSGALAGWRAGQLAQAAAGDHRKKGWVARGVLTAAPVVIPMVKFGLTTYFVGLPAGAMTLAASLASRVGNHQRDTMNAWGHGYQGELTLFVEGPDGTNTRVPSSQLPSPLKALLTFIANTAVAAAGNYGMAHGFDLATGGVLARKTAEFLATPAGAQMAAQLGLSASDAFVRGFYAVVLELSRISGYSDAEWTFGKGASVLADSLRSAQSRAEMANHIADNDSVRTAFSAISGEGMAGLVGLFPEGSWQRNVMLALQSILQGAGEFRGTLVQNGLAAEASAAATVLPASQPLDSPGIVKVIADALSVAAVADSQAA